MVRHSQTTGSETYMFGDPQDAGVKGYDYNLAGSEHRWQNSAAGGVRSLFLPLPVSIRHFSSVRPAHSARLDELLLYL